MSTVQTSRNRDNLHKMLKHAMDSCFSNLINNSALKVADNPSELIAASDLAHIMLTVAGLQFRATVLLHYPTGKNALSLLNQFAGDDRSTKTEKDIEPYYTELGNQFCGEIKRHMYKQFDHLGMSTPSIMAPATVMSDINNSQMLAECHHVYLSGTQAALGGSIYAFSNQPIEFEFDSSSYNEVITTGELEFF